MDWLNYHHLLYFWTVAREGSVSRAAARLRLAQPTVSAQIRTLERAIGERLFQRQGRTIVLTDVGRIVFRYADEIFGLGRELSETLKGRPSGRALQLTIGVANAVPKLVVWRLLRPAFSRADPYHLVCREHNAEQLIAQLATHSLDVVIADTPAPPHVRVKAFSHLLGESPLAFFAPARLAPRVRRRFPASLREVPVLLPTANTALRRRLDEWFAQQDVRPNVAGEFEDPALMTVVGHAAGIIFPAPAAIARDVCRVFGVQVVGRVAAVREQYYAISVERRLTHPGVVAITSAARGKLFTQP
jgi:LysR family transcriptional activator of nhaA